MLCAPSLGGESFGMVLTEAFAAGTPVVASRHRRLPRRRARRRRRRARPARRRDRAGRGAARPRARARAPRARWPREAAEHAQRYAWPHVAAEVLRGLRGRGRRPGARDRAARALAVRAGAGARRRAAAACRPGACRRSSRDPAGGSRAGRRFARRAGVALAAAAAVRAPRSRAAAHRRAPHRRVAAAPRARPGCSSPSGSCACRWSCAPSPGTRSCAPRCRRRRVRTPTRCRARSIGVLMSATLPARLGEPARAMIVARRVGRPRETLPVVLGTIVSQTLLNILALLILGVTMFSTVELFDGRHTALVLFAAVAAGDPRRGARRPGAAAQRRAAPPPLRRCRADRARRARAGARRPAGLPRAAARRASRRSPSSARGRSSGCPATSLLVALGLDDRAGIGAAAAVLFAVNVTAVLPATPSNLGVFQAACVAVLTGAYGVSVGRRAGLRDHPAGRRDRDRRRHGRARAAARGPDLEGRAPARAARLAGRAARRCPAPRSARERAEA